MSDTPETDAALYPMNQVDIVWPEFARKLEESRNEWAAMCGRYKQERDEAQESLKHITEYGTEEINAAVELRQKLATALVERDEWKNKAYSHATDYTLMEAKCFRLEQQLKEYDKLKS
jgi:delta-aminolevulinic acid dehydratase/porphobilinogen synthase